MHILHVGAKLRPKPDTSGGFSPNYRPPPVHVELADSITRLDERISAFHVHPQWLADLRREAYIANAQASAAIEGNPLTLEKSQDVIRKHETKSLRRPQPEEREILQHFHYFEDLRRISLREPPDLTVGEIANTHGLLLSSVLEPEKTPGRLRGLENHSFVSVGNLECTPPERVSAELEALLYWYYSEGLSLPPVIRLGIWFVEFESIHPFRDGNGRVGRALTHRLLYTDGLSNSVFVALDRPFSDDRPGYYGALSSVHESDRYEIWVEHFLRALKQAYETSLEILQAVGGIPATLTGALRAIMEYLLRSGRQEFSVADLALQLGRYKPITITMALHRLAKETDYVVHNGVAGRGSRYRIGPGVKNLLLGTPRF